MSDDLPIVSQFERTRRSILLSPLPKREDPTKTEQVDYEDTRVGVLLVDSDPQVNEYVASMLQAEGYNVKWANSSGSARELLDQYYFELAILDNALAKDLTNELFDYIRAQHAEMEVIITARNPQLSEAVHYVRGGAFDYLPKPLNTQGLLALLSSVDGGIQRQQAEYRRRLNQSVFGNCQFDFEELLKDYTLMKVLGNGTAGAVFLVMLENCEYRAIKILRRCNTQHMYERLESRFMREAQILSSLNHPHIVKIHEFGIHKETQLPYMVMDYIDGGTMYDFMKKNPGLDTKLRVLSEVADALSAVHSKGILHRDIKPANILIDENESSHLTDFGVARIEDSSLTIENELIGSPAYFSPEGVVTGGITDAQSDIFSLGVVAYEFIVGRRPFYGDTTPEMMNSIASCKPPAPRRINPDIPQDVEALLAKMLAKNKSARYKKAKDVVNAINACRNNLLPPAEREDGNDFIDRIIKFISSPLPATWSDDTHQ